MLRIDHQEVHNGDGWWLSLRRTFDTEKLDPDKDPLLIIPGYGMNSFIFGFHPRGTSMEATLAERGFEVWSVDLRAQGKSRRDGGSMRYRLEDLVLRDVASAVRGVRERTGTRADRVDLLGCSLGATMMFGHVVTSEDHGVGRMVNMGGPVRWVRIHPLLKLAFRSPELVGQVRIFGTRRMASVALPALKHAPWLLSIYLHPDIVDMTQARQLIRTVENPNRFVNRDIAAWIKHGDPIFGGVNVAEALPGVTLPLLTVIANADGIVPRETTSWPHQVIGSARKDVLEVGTESEPIAHADMFVSHNARDILFKPLADWLEG